MRNDDEQDSGAWRVRLFAGMAIAVAALVWVLSGGEAPERAQPYADAGAGPRWDARTSGHSTPPDGADPHPGSSWHGASAGSGGSEGAGGLAAARCKRPPPGWTGPVTRLFRVLDEADPDNPNCLVR